MDDMNAEKLCLTHKSTGKYCPGGKIPNLNIQEIKTSVQNSFLISRQIKGRYKLHMTSPENVASQSY